MKMADPENYRNLPYVAVDQPDFYESADLPESDQGLKYVEEQDEVVEKLVVDPKEAFSRFNKASIDGSRSNFSDEALPGRTGYSVQYETISSGHRADETIVQRLQRLKHELKEIEDLAKLEFDGEAAPSSIMTEVEMLQKQVESFSSGGIASSDGNAMAYGQLLTQLKAVSKNKPKVDSTGDKSQETPNQTLYEMRITPDSAISGKEANLDARITQLEELLGSSTNWSALSESSGAQPVMDILSTISSKVHLLEEDNVNKLSARLQILLQTLTKVKEDNASAEAQGLEKINELYELVKKWDSYVDSLPLIVDRLYSLQDLHQQAMEFSASLKALEAAQSELGQSVGSHQQLLTDVHKTFATNVDVIKSNVETLEKRIESLKIV